ncbi:MAG: CDP-diacylglycerol--serine O-phosphatidyltransferase [Chitinophagales bacterium]|nr:CDP-diacylglycerol--serine O-phosphatidyltransferase [Bacteroidota bacterium]MCB9042188.1 CDP-diacylglycerol--serine O-phosphatidyltransferase [Chitinophagales bacterium]
MRQFFPNFLSLSNGFAGCLAIVQAFEGNFYASMGFILLAAIFDFFDGFAARLFKVSSELGKQLDSLCDAVSFGVAPASILYLQMCQTASFSTELNTYLCYVAFIFAVAAIYRLGKFNLDTRQQEGFLGLPTPAATLAVIGFLPWAFSTIAWQQQLTQNFYFWLILCLVLSVLMVSEIPMLALKFKDFSWKKNTIRYLFLATSVLLAIVFRSTSLPFIMGSYILFSIINARART